MAKKKVVLKFPASLVETPLASELVSDYGLVVNILRARVEPDEEGMLVVELSGQPKEIASGLAHVRELGVEVQELAQDVVWHENRCTECTACRSVCPTEALRIRQTEMTVEFDKEKCIACELCIAVCPYGAVEIQF